MCLSCVTKKNFEIKSSKGKNSSENFHVVMTSSSHIMQECVFLNAEDENRWRHQYVMYVLNDQKEIIEVLHYVNQDKSSCLSQAKEVSKILKKEPTVTLCLRGNLKADPMSTEFYNFNKFEKYPIKYSFLTFDSICNLKNCYSVNDIWTNTCPGFTKN